MMALRRIRMSTIREIAKRVGFSQATVSRVLKDDPTFSVKDSTREKILNASLEMGYKNVPQYQRITIPQDVAILDNVVPDEGLQDAYFDELRERDHAEGRGFADRQRRQIRRLHFDWSVAVGS